MPEIVRCDWANRSELEKNYHDTQWGIPIHDDRALFAMLNLEGQQAGLSWSTILSKMETLYQAYDGFDPEILVTYGEEKFSSLEQADGVIKNRLKIRSVAANAHAYFGVCEEFGSLDNYLWGFVDYEPVVNSWESIEQVPAVTQLSTALSKDLKRRGFKFLGPVTVYAFMQATGMVNDHLVSCFVRNKAMSIAS